MGCPSVSAHTFPGMNSELLDARPVNKPGARQIASSNALHRATLNLKNIISRHFTGTFPSAYGVNHSARSVANVSPAPHANILPKCILAKRGCQGHLLVRVN